MLVVESQLHCQHFLAEAPSPHHCGEVNERPLLDMPAEQHLNNIRSMNKSEEEKSQVYTLIDLKFVAHYCIHE